METEEEIADLAILGHDAFSNLGNDSCQIGIFRVEVADQTTLVTWWYFLVAECVDESVDLPRGQ